MKHITWLSVLLLCLLWISSSEEKSFIEDLTLTYKEKQSLDKFREMVNLQIPHEYMKQDVYLIRWLRATDFNLQNAKKKLLDNLKWRKENKIDTILQEDFSDLARDFKYFVESKDKEGKPVLYANIESWDVRNAVVSGKVDRLFRYIDQAMEKGVTLVREMGEKYHNVSQGDIILNAYGFNLSQHASAYTVAILLKIISSYEAHYPGMIDKLIVINAPLIAQPLITISRRALHPITNKSVVIYGTNRNLWEKALKKDFSLDELPPELGGTKYYIGSDDENK